MGNAGKLDDVGEEELKRIELSNLVRSCIACVVVMALAGQDRCFHDCGNCGDVVL